MVASKRRAGPQLDSQATQRRERMAVMHGENQIGANMELKGRVRQTRAGGLEFYDKKDNRWIPAAYHEQFRKEFIETAKKAEKSYSNGPRRGADRLDATANCSYMGQNEWEFDRDGWNSILDQQNRQVMKLADRPDDVAEGPEPEWWVHKGLLLLDGDNHPVNYWTCIPLTFSSELEGGRMEALRRVFPWLKIQDFRSRMPRYPQHANGNNLPLSTHSTFTQRMARFRKINKLKPWIESGNKSRKRKGRMTETDQEDSEDDDEPLQKKVQQSAPMTEMRDAGPQKNQIQHEAPIMGPWDQKAQEFLEDPFGMDDPSIGTLPPNDPLFNTTPQAQVAPQQPIHHSGTKSKSLVLDPSTSSDQTQYMKPVYDTHLTTSPEAMSPENNITSPEYSASTPGQVEQYPAAPETFDSSVMSDQKDLAPPGHLDPHPQQAEQTLRTPGTYSPTPMTVPLLAGMSTDPTHAPEQHFQQHPLANTTTPTTPQTLTDLRCVDPTTLQDRLAIHLALHITRLHFSHHHNGVPPPTTNVASSYWAQYAQLQNSHGAYSNPFEPVSELVCLGPWYGFAEEGDFGTFRVPGSLSEEEIQGMMGASDGGANHAVHDVWEDFDLNMALGDLGEGEAWTEADEQHIMQQPEQ